MQEPKSKPVILIVEDTPVVRETYRMYLEEFLTVPVEIATAVDVTSAKVLIDQNPQALLMSVDGKLLGGDRGVDVIAYAKKVGFKGLIIAASGDINDELMKAGATHQASKSLIPQFLVDRIEEILA